MSVKNVKEAVITALKRHSKGLKKRTTWRGSREDGTLQAESSRVRWPDSEEQYTVSAVNSALRDLMLEGKIYVKRDGGRSTYLYDPKRAEEQWKVFKEITQRLKSCQEKLAGHGFTGLKIKKKDPEVWLRSSKFNKESYEFVEIHIDELEEFIRELRSREKRF